MRYIASKFIWNDGENVKEHKKQKKNFFITKEKKKDMQAVAIRKFFFDNLYIKLTMSINIPYNNYYFFYSFQLEY